MRGGIDPAETEAELVEDIALIGPWAKTADELPRWRQTVLTTFLISCEPRLLDEVTDVVRG